MCLLAWRDVYLRFMEMFRQKNQTNQHQAKSQHRVVDYFPIKAHHGVFLQFLPFLTNHSLLKSNAKPQLFI